MNDEITERVLNDENNGQDTEPSASTGTFSRAQALSAVGVAIGMWTLLGVAVGWGESLYPMGTSPMGAIAATVAWTILTVAGVTACRLPFIPDLRDGLWDILTLWGVVVFGSGALVGIVLWGPPAFGELLRGGQP